MSEINQKRKILVDTARSFVGSKFSSQGRNRTNGFDCGGLVMCSARESNIYELEVLGYKDFPHDGKFESLLEDHCISHGIISTYPHNFDGTEAQPGDIMSFDYQNEEGLRHIGLITQWDGIRYWVVDAMKEYGISEHAVALEFAKAKLQFWTIKGIDD